MTDAVSNLHDIAVAFDTNADGLFIKRSQEIPDYHIAGLREERDTNRVHRAPEFHRVASLPTNLVELWLRQGFDVHQESAKAIVARLRRENLEAFLTSDKIG